MKLIYKVALTELRNLFYSPIAWFLGIAFLVQCALSYTLMLQPIASAQEMGGMALQFQTRLTTRIFSNNYGSIFYNAMQNLYLYIPLLTMGLISREMNGGTVSLLYSSPVKVREIVWGKYLAMMVFNLVLLAALAIFMITGAINIQNPDTGILWAAALGFYLLLCAYAAIGLFMSSLTTYQVVAAVGTFIIIGILTYIGNLWQDIDLVRDITYFLSLRGRAQHMLSGLISTRDVLYFILIVYMFLGFTIYKLKGDRESKPLSVRLGRYAIVLVLALLIGYVTSRPSLTGYQDLTVNKDNTLTPNAQRIIKALGDSTLEITSYSNYLDNFNFYGMPDARNGYLEEWEPYLRFKPDIKFRYVNYYDTAYGNGYDMFKEYPGMTLKQIVAKRAKPNSINTTMFKTPEEIRRIIDLRPELNRYVMQLKYRGRSTFLRVFNDQFRWPSETEVSAAFERLLQDRMPKILFVTGGGERSFVNKKNRGYNSLVERRVFRYSLINQGFDVDTVSLDTQAIPDSTTALVVADPLHTLSPEAQRKIREYVTNGGNLVIAGEPGRQHLINPLLKPLGVQLMDGMLQQKGDEQAPALVLPMMTDAVKQLSQSMTFPMMDTPFVSAWSAAGLQYSDTTGFSVTPLLQTIRGRATNTNARNPDMDLVDDDSLSFASHELSQSSVYTTVVALTRQVKGKEQRIIVSGDADFMSNGELEREQPQVFNFYFAMSLFSWMDYGQFPINTSRPKPKDNRVNVSINDVAALKLAYIWILPGALLLLGTVVLIRRKRK